MITRTESKIGNLGRAFGLVGQCGRQFKVQMTNNINTQLGLSGNDKLSSSEASKIAAGKQGLPNEFNSDVLAKIIKKVACSTNNANVCANVGILIPN